MKHGTALILVVLVVLAAAFGIAAVIPGASTAWAQVAPSPVPARDGSPDFGPVREKIAALMKDSGVPSVSVALARKGKIVWTESFGWADVEKRIEATPDTPYSLASITKPITATGLMVLVDRGLVKLDSPVDAYLGGVRLTPLDPGAAPVTVRHVLNHSAGLPLHYQFFYAGEPARRPAMAETVRRYGICVFGPGEVYQYSNLGYGIIDDIIARVSGRSYAEFVREEIFAPLGMDRSSIEVGPALGIAGAAERYEEGRPVPFYEFDHPGGSAAYASARDLVRFGMFHLGDALDGRKPDLGAGLLAAMTDRKASTAPEAAYCIGWRVDTDDHGFRTVSHTGGMPGVSTELKLVPAEDIAVCVLANGRAAGVYTLDDDILAAVLPRYAAAMKARPKTAPPAPSKFTAPKVLLGTWEGRIRTYEGEMPLELVFEPDGDVRVRVRDALETLLNNARLERGVLGGVCYGSIKTGDAARAPHVLQFRLKIEGDRMVGFVSAQAERWFALSSAVELNKKT
jgi:CubicO group peptidase (beta-lactamase class C family)